MESNQSLPHSNVHVSQIYVLHGISRPANISRESGSMSVTRDARRLVISTLTTFDIYKHNETTPEASFDLPPGDIHAIPVLFAHGDTAILVGSASGDVGVWNAQSYMKHQTLMLRGASTRSTVFTANILTEGDKALAIAVRRL